jgi:uncharacterized iron-regulated protein
MTMIKRGIPCIAIAAFLLTPALAQAQTPTQPAAAQVQAPAPAADKPDPTLTLKIGNPKLKDKTMEVGPGAILSAETGAAIDFERMIRDMMTSRIVHVGETHDSMPMHELQFQVIRALYARDKHLAVGLEMLPVTVQETLNKWTAGILTKDEFIREIRWYVNWNFNFGYYEKIFDFAREHRLPIYALNIPREIITKIRMRGWDALSQEEKALIPGTPDLTNQDHRALIRAVFESSDLPPQMKGAGLGMVFEGLYRSQSAWDEVMGANAVRAAESEGRRVVVCAGSGHLVYNLGLNLRAFERSKMPFKTVIAVSIPVREEGPDRLAGDRRLRLRPAGGGETGVPDDRPELQESRRSRESRRRSETDRRRRRPLRSREGGHRPLGRRKGLHGHQRNSNDAGQAQMRRRGQIQGPARRPGQGRRAQVREEAVGLNRAAVTEAFG